jgi:hypothetical protein
MPEPAPLNSVPFLAHHADDMQTRRICLGSLARMTDTNRLFWQSAWMKDNSVAVPPTLAIDKTKAWDIVFLSREQPFVS